MSSKEIAIRATRLGKRYEIYTSPRDRLKQFLMPRLQGLTGRKPQQYFREFWALNDVSFDINKGEAIGIVGRNGSGKSTLLQILCGTLTPTAGSLQTKGRIAALLELGSGFNHEFTGRENVYLNAALLGLSKEETNARFDRIAAFADIGHYMDQPVRTYSSGMYLRLAFAIIAHVDADILVIDEALAVGDAVFSQKCLRFIRKFKETGTLIFVSHDMSSVLSLCEKAIWLHDGGIRLAGEARQISEAYLQYILNACYGSEALEPPGSVEQSNRAAGTDNAALSPLSPLTRQPDQGLLKNLPVPAEQIYDWNSGAGRITAVEIKVSETAKTLFFGGEKIHLVIRATVHRAMDKPVLGFMVMNRLGQHLFGENTLALANQSPLLVVAGAFIEAEFIFALPLLPKGKFFISAALANGDVNELVQHHWLHDACAIEISSSSVANGQFGVPFEKISLSARS